MFAVPCLFDSWSDNMTFRWNACSAVAESYVPLEARKVCLHTIGHGNAARVVVGRCQKFLVFLVVNSCLVVS